MDDFFQKNLLFLINLILTGALIFGAPVFVKGEELKEGRNKADEQSVFDVEKAEERTVDYSGEGQIHKPSYEITTGPGTEGFADDSTDNTYDYYTIMGVTTVTLDEMTSLYEQQGAEYPDSLKEGDAVESQFNFSGLGTTREGVQGNSYQTSEQE